MSDEDEYMHPMQQQMETVRVMNESVSHELHLWLANLDNDSLDKVGMVLHAGINYPAWGAQMLGFLQGERLHRYGVCPVCQKNHAQEEHDLLAPRPAETPPVTEGTPIPGTPFHVGDAAAMDDMAKDLIGRTFHEYVKLCIEYNVTPNPDQSAQVFCKKCNMRYPNLDDRMLNRIDECSGCQQFDSTGIRFPEPDKQ